MTVPSAARPRILVIPHVGLAGGAGLYNRAAIDVLVRDADVTLLGEAAADYTGADRTIAPIASPPRPILPAYAGASARAFIFHAVLAPWRYVAMKRWSHRYRATLANYDAIVVTSSIDMLSVAAIAGPGTRHICIVQENVFLSGIRGAIARHLLRRADTLVSISDHWSARASAYGIASVVAPNPFDQPGTPGDVDDVDASFDLLFMGGGERIKGIDLFLALIERLASRRQIRAMMLGSLTPARAQQVAALQATLAGTGSVLATPGFVADTTARLRDTLLLLLPITDPHFCRPAIEAGFCGRTFVISRLPELDDFARPGENCLMADRSDIDEWERCCHQLLDDSVERRRLAGANRERSVTRFSGAAFADAWHRIVSACR